MRIPLALITLAASSLMFASSAPAFCGFYVAKADAKLFNRSSKVVVGAQGSTDRGHHGQRLSRRSQGVRAGRARTNRREP
jgi:hypothetical protein